MKVFTTLLTALFCTVPFANSWAETQKSSTLPNLAPERYSVKTVNTTDKDEANAVPTLYKNLDQDTVDDRFDHCLNTGADIAVDKYGCELDSDKDGIFDRFDQCPNTPVGVPVNFLGCEGDQDKDGVVDSKDECPNTPLGTKVDDKGCKVETVAVAPDTLVISNIVFDTDSFYIRADQRPILEEDATKLRQLQESEVLIITGHTDIVASAEYNIVLSWNRAQSTKDYLVKTFGIPEEKIYVQGMGKAQPVATNDTAEGRQQNRRIELQIKALQDLPEGIKNNIPEEILGNTRYKHDQGSLAFVVGAQAFNATNPVLIGPGYSIQRRGA